MSEELPDLIIKCKKCYNLLYISKDSPESLITMMNNGCPKCSEDGHETWILFGEGNFEKERRDK